MHELKDNDEAAADTPRISAKSSEQTLEKDVKSSSLGQKIQHVLIWCPARCRWDPANPPKFSMSMNILFAFSGAFAVANLYYNQPILNVLALEFAVPYETAARIPTVMQAGYAAGLLFLCPLGDSLPRRPFTLGLVFFTATMWIGLCVTDSFEVFTAISFITGVTTVTPQLLLPLVGDLAPPNRRGSSLSICVSGFMLGILIARVLSGTVANYTSWRNIYWLSLGLQYLIFGLLWLFMPDYPATNPALRSLPSYLRMLWSIGEIFFTEPTLVQACLIGFFTSAPFTNFWTTLTFLLAGPPYEYSSLVIGLFALIGIAAMCVTPLYGRLVIDRLTPLWSAIIGVSLGMIGTCIGTYTGLFTVAGPVIQAFLIDLGLQGSQIANRAAIYSIAPKARNRVNTAFMVFSFCGQLTGTAVGNRLYARGGWVQSGSYSVASLGAALLVCVVKGPFEPGWVGWMGGWGLVRRKAVETASSPGEASPSLESEDHVRGSKDGHGSARLSVDGSAQHSTATV